MKKATICFRLITLFAAVFGPFQGRVDAQAPATVGSSFAVPVFEQVDANGVDLVKGQLRIMSPTISAGSDEAKVTVGLQWVGSGWALLEQPTIWRDGDKYFVVYRGSSEEFKRDGDYQYVQQKPINGAKLTCLVFQPGNISSDCRYTSREGDVLHFRGRYSSITPYPEAYGFSTYAFGNIGMAEVRLYSADNRNRTWGNYTIGGIADSGYNLQTYVLKLENTPGPQSVGAQTLKIFTPNHSVNSSGSNLEQHYLRPRNTTQTITDDVGSVWAYTVNNDRLLTTINPPGAAASIQIAYYSDKRVKTVTNADGIWNYSYQESGGFGTTVVTNPLSHTTTVRYNIDKGYVVEHRDALQRVTLYRYDSGDRLDQITYPELNRLNFTYDARGNILTKVTTPKPGQGTAYTESAFYSATCANDVLCNLPQYTIDARGGRTDFTYASTSMQTVEANPGFGNVPVTYGTRKPVTVTLPAPSEGAIRPVIRNEYNSGVLIKSSICMTQAVCAGTADEVVTAYTYGVTHATTRLVFGVEQISGGVTLRTCYGYDNQGRRVSSTPPNAGVGSCPVDIVTALSADQTPPAIGAPAVAPVYPDGSTGAGPPTPPTPPGENCGTGGVVCQ